jgi:hypothetical protein
MKTISKNCLNCTITFNASLKEHKRGKAKFCSMKCSGENQTKNTIPKQPNCSCAACGTEFYKSYSKLKGSKSGLYFCSRACKDKSQRLGGIEEIMPPHYGTGKIGYTYRDIAFQNHESKCNRCGYDKYIKVLHVHHKNRNRSDASPGNLEILCPTCHLEDHFLAGDGPFTSQL